MPVEIERKFLVRGTPWQPGTGVRYCQGYLNRDAERAVRVRIAGSKAFLTIKGASRGLSRAEFEYAIPLADAEQLLRLSDGAVIEKNRYLIVHEGFRWEVDEFLGDNAGLVVAEIELSSEEQAFSRPAWVGQEVTGDRRYFNSSLVSEPYRSWHTIQSLSGILCLRHIMTIRSQYAQTTQATERGRPQAGR